MRVDWLFLPVLCIAKSLCRHVASPQNVDFSVASACTHHFHGNILVASTCIHDFHAKKILPFNSPFLYFVLSRENSPISQQIDAITCNDQL